MASSLGNFSLKLKDTETAPPSNLGPSIGLPEGVGVVLLRSLAFAFPEKVGPVPHGGCSGCLYYWIRFLGWKWLTCLQT
jgi:hypothetical protein